MTVRLPPVVGFAKAMELVITVRGIGVQEAERIGLVNEIEPRGVALERAHAQQLAREIAALPQEQSAATRRASCGGSAARSRNACASRPRW